jgi:hypothetical protein
VQLLTKSSFTAHNRAWPTFTAPPRVHTTDLGLCPSLGPRGAIRCTCLGLHSQINIVCFCMQRVHRFLQYQRMHALTNAPQAAKCAAVYRSTPLAAASALRHRAWRLSTHASSNGVQPVAGSAQQLHSSTNGQQPAPQQPSRILRYAGLVADDFRCDGMSEYSLAYRTRPQKCRCL